MKNLKLNFSKETVAKLQNGEMLKIKGGDVLKTEGVTCNYCPAETSPEATCLAYSEHDGTRCHQETLACQGILTIHC